MYDCYLVCPQRYAQGFATIDMSWMPVVGPKGSYQWRTPSGELVGLISSDRSIYGIPRGTRIHLGFRWWEIAEAGSAYLEALFRNRGFVTN